MYISRATHYEDKNWTEMVQDRVGL